ncbi:lipopolysaccharide biosynthesis protein [Luteibaculum oceani]|uniref:Oligosaccharide flippase family protein n=1 Tax=Luteibaculum oceani TaxID=1294296 RepID=A0A5C6UUC3_9FLAO|nr:oligosaccharide flippase family protein [Luteibaculum oceani]TXC76917.1 oligosaccharide flippase family protein [Luteibaculum oceani]
MRTGLFKNVAILLSGNVFALIIPFIAAPIITRLYTPEDFGSFELFAKLLAFAVVLASLRYELAMVLPKKEEHSANLATIALRFSLMFSCAILILTLLFKSDVAQLMDNAGLETLLVYLGPLVAVTTLFSIINQSLIRAENFKKISSIKIVSTTSNQLVKVAGGYAGMGSLGLLWGQLLGLVFPIFMGWKSLKKKLNGFRFKSSKSEREQMKVWQEFPKANLPHGLTDEGEKLILLALISAYFGAWSLGLFAFTLRYLRIPLQLFGASIGQALYPKISKAHNAGEAYFSLILRVTGLLFLISTVGFGTLFLFGEEIFAFVLGQDWAEAGNYASYMAPWLGLNFIASPVSTIPTILKRQKTFFRISLAISLFSLIGIWQLAELSWGFYEVLGFLVLVQSIGMLVKLLWILFIAKQNSGK